MSYGATAYGAAALGGIPGAAGLFFSRDEALDAGTHRRTQEYTGDADFYAVYLQMESTSEPQLRTIRIYSHNDPFETPQLQVTTGEAFYSQTIIGAARFIVVELELSETLSTIGTNITGAEYFQ